MKIPGNQRVSSLYFPQIVSLDFLAFGVAFLERSVGKKHLKSLQNMGKIEGDDLPIHHEK